MQEVEVEVETKGYKAMGLSLGLGIGGQTYNMRVAERPRDVATTIRILCVQ